MKVWEGENASTYRGTGTCPHFPKESHLEFELGHHLRRIDKISNVAIPNFNTHIIHSHYGLSLTTLCHFYIDTLE